MTPKTELDCARLLLEFSRMKLMEEYWPRLRECVESLTAEQVWWRPNAASNSVGNLLLHLNGNVRQWLVTSFNRHHKDSRDRPSEFKQREELPASTLLAQLGATLEEASQVLSRLTEAELAAPMEIQGYKVRGLEAVFHVVEHFAQHYGQIAYITKMLRGADLGFYRQLNETGRLPQTP